MYPEWEMPNEPSNAQRTLMHRGALKNMTAHKIDKATDYSADSNASNSTNVYFQRTESGKGNTGRAGLWNHRLLKHWIAAISNTAIFLTIRRILRHFEHDADSLHYTVFVITSPGGEGRSPISAMLVKNLEQVTQMVINRILISAQVWTSAHWVTLSTEAMHLISNCRQDI